MVRGVLLSVGALLIGTSAASGQPASGPPERPAERASERITTIPERARDLRKQDGFLPFYWDAKKGQLLIEISRWGDQFLYGVGLAGGAGLLEVSLDRGQ